MVYLARLLCTFTWQVYLARSGLNALGPRHGLPILRRWIGRWGASEAHSARPQHGTKAAHEPPGRRPVLPLSCIWPARLRSPRNDGAVAGLRNSGWEADERPEPRSLGLLPSGPDPVGEWLVPRQPPMTYIGCRRSATNRGRFHQSDEILKRSQIFAIREKERFAPARGRFAIGAICPAVLSIALPDRSQDSTAKIIAPVDLFGAR